MHQRSYNARMSVVENIKLPPTLLSRFDLIFLILDKVSTGSTGSMGVGEGVKG